MVYPGDGPEQLQLLKLFQVKGVTKALVRAEGVKAITDPQAFRTAGAKFKNLDFTSSQPALRADGETITLGEWNLLRAYASDFGSTSGGVDRARQDAIRRAILRSEATKRGIVVGDAEVDSSINKVRSDLAKALNRSEFDALLAGLGVTEDEYWRLPWVRHEQMMGVLADKVAATIRAQVPRNPGEDDRAYTERSNGYYHQWLEDHVRGARLEQLMP